MPGPSNVALGSVAYQFVLQVTIPAGAPITASTSVERTYPVPGLQVGDHVSVNKPSLTAGIVIGTARVSAVDTLAITFGNCTAATPSLPASENYLLRVTRHSFPSVAQIPTAIA